MKLFQESETLEGFERNLNDENSRINNLDLNGDNLIDYITVNDYVDGNVHTIVLRVALSRKETQDVAVFTVEKFRDGSANIQLIGDEALYGRNYIIEPIYDETPNPGYMGRQANRTSVTVIRTTPYEISFWPIIRFIYVPNYVVWHSSWYWGYYPSYWHPWRPYYWHYYYGYHYNWYHHYYSHYHHWHQPRYARYNDFYYRGLRAYSPMVSTRIKEGQYSATYARPEQRREGEALFTKMYPSQTRRTAENTINRSQERRSDSQTSNGRISTETSTDVARRSANTSTSRSPERPSTVQNQGASRSRRTPATIQDRASSKPESNQSTGTVRRSTTTTNERAASSPGPKPGQSTGTVRRSTTPTTNRAASSPGPKPGQSTGTISRKPAASSERAVSKPAYSQQRTEPSRPSKQSAPSSSSSRSRSSEKKASTPASKSEKSKESETAKPTRR